MFETPPLIFIHYGPARYLKWTLQAARRTNPYQRIILLGDERNRHFTRGLAEFFFFEDYAQGELLQEFERVFQVIQGERHRFHKEGGVESWLHFVFRRWFLIHEFIKRHHIDAFWTFDSDTLLLTNLDKVQSRFAAVEATTHCLGRCLNGWVGSQSLVERYLLCINELFQDADYLQKQKERLRGEPTLSFNEMDAFSEFCTREGIKTVRASQRIDGEAFDDALAIANGYEQSPPHMLGKNNPVKCLWISAHGELFVRQLADQQMVRLLSCNMSWMPNFFWKRLLRLTNPKRNKYHLFFKKRPGLKKVNLGFPWTHHLHPRNIRINRPLLQILNKTMTLLDRPKK